MASDLLIEENVFQTTSGEDAMVTQDKFGAIIQLAQRGIAKKAIARLLEIDIKTVRRHLKKVQWQPYQRCTIKKRLLDDYTNWIKARLLEVNYNASVIFQELKLMGYKGCYETVKEFVAPLRLAYQLENKAYMRYETLPGEQSQVDWGSAWVWLGDKRQKIHIFTLVLGYSRRLFAKAYFDEKTAHLLAGHEAAFQWFEGYTKEILYDNPKTMVLNHDVETGEVLLNSTFKDFCSHYQFKPRFCKPYRAQTKGKIESGVKYIKRNFLAGRRFKSLAHLNQELEKWLLTISDERIHGTTHEKPSVRFLEESSCLSPLSEIKPYCLIPVIQRKVSQDAMVNYNSNRYSVPWIYSGKKIEIHLSEDKILIMLDGKEIAKHKIIEERHKCAINREHFSGLFKSKYAKEVPHPPQYDPQWWDDFTVMVRELNYYEKAVGCEGGAKQWQ